MLPKRRITDEEAQWCRDNIKQMESLVPEEGKATPEEIRVAVSRANAVRGRNERALKKYAEQDKEPDLPMEMHVLRIGEVAFASNRFELYMDFQHRIQARSPFLQTFIVQLAAQPELDNGTYLPTERGRANRGFGASVYDNIVTPEAGQIIVEESLKALEKLAEE